MVDDLDLFRSASTLLKHFGREEALARARKNEIELLDKGNIIGASAWRAIYSAIEDLGDIEAQGKRIH